MIAKAQGPRTEVVSVAVSSEEKKAVRAVASAHGISESLVLRDRTIAEVMEQYEKILRAVSEDG